MFLRCADSHSNLNFNAILDIVKGCNLQLPPLKSYFLPYLTYTNQLCWVSFNVFKFIDVIHIYFLFE